jgi:hypothetical protein
MPTIILELTEVKRQNLLAFLKRTSLTGEEAFPFVMLFQEIAQAQAQPKEEIQEPPE